MEVRANYATHSCLIPAFESFEIGASAKRFDVKCFLSTLATFELAVMVVVIGVVMLLGTGEGRVRA
jgi:hypothetical protein